MMEIVSDVLVAGVAIWALAHTVETRRQLRQVVDELGAWIVQMKMSRVGKK